MTFKATNWNEIIDEVDKDVWDRVNKNHWLDTKVPLAGDIKAWSTLTEAEKICTMKVFGGLTMLDTLQSDIGVASLKPDARTPHEKAVLGQFEYMESIHTKLYSSIFSTLCSVDEIRWIFKWTEENPYLQRKVQIIKRHYDGDCKIMRKAASVALESLLFYSGFYMPMYWFSRSKLQNTAHGIKLIIADESIHGYYIGYKFRLDFEELTIENRLNKFAEINEMFQELYDNEVAYIHYLYDDLNLTNDVIKFLNYNHNKAFQNLGFEPIFNEEQTDTSPAVLAALLSGANHDFFSGNGTQYEAPIAEETESEDWAF